MATTVRHALEYVQYCSGYLFSTCIGLPLSATRGKSRVFLRDVASGYICESRLAQPKISALSLNQEIIDTRVHCNCYVSNWKFEKWGIS